MLELSRLNKNRSENECLSAIRHFHLKVHIFETEASSPFKVSSYLKDVKMLKVSKNRQNA